MKRYTVQVNMPLLLSVRAKSARDAKTQAIIDTVMEIRGGKFDTVIADAVQRLNTDGVNYPESFAEIVEEF